MPWRENYEAWATAGWATAGLALLGAAVLSPYPPGPLLLTAGLALATGGRRAWAAGRLARWQRNLRGRPLTFIDLDTLSQQMDGRSVWLGCGFEWRPRHAQRIHECLTRQQNPVLDGDTSAADGAVGVPWLHGVGDTEGDIRLPLAHQAGHLLLVGTTRSFKTKLLLLIAAQAVLRGEPLVVIDPKGDPELRRVLQAACHQAGRPRDFVYFHPAFPERSARIDPLHNFSNASEIASRLAALIPSETGNDPFTAFSWNALNNVVSGLLEVEERPNLVKLRRYVEGGSEELLVRALRRYAERTQPAAAAQVAAQQKKGDTPVTAWIRFYRKTLQPHRPSPALEGLIAMAEHDQVHFSKMVASLIPVLAMLTSPPLDHLLSPDPAAADPRRATHLAQILEHGQVLYVGLDSLSNPAIGSAIGSLFTADLTAHIGTRYNYRPESAPVTLIIDEAAEALNDPMIALLNKGGGAGARLVLATQTLGDFEARLGSPAKARQVLGNVNNLIVGRVRDAETQDYIAESLPKTQVHTVSPSQGSTSDATTPLVFSGGWTEAVTREEAALFDARWLGLIPNLEYIALLSGSRVLKGRLPILRVPADGEAPP